jgi:hypothetical protein
MMPQDIHQYDFHQKYNSKCLDTRQEAAKKDFKDSKNSTDEYPVGNPRKKAY